MQAPRSGSALRREGNRRHQRPALHHPKHPATQGPSSGRWWPATDCWPAHKGAAGPATPNRASSGGRPTGGQGAPRRLGQGGAHQEEAALQRRTRSHHGARRRHPPAAAPTGSNGGGGGAPKEEAAVLGRRRLGFPYRIPPCLLNRAEPGRLKPSRAAGWPATRRWAEPSRTGPWQAAEPGQAGRM